MYKNKNEKFYVIIIDDKLESCNRIERKITGGQTLGQLDPIIPVFAKSIHIKLEEIGSAEKPEESNWTFSRETIPLLIDAAAQKPDMIIIDYIYVDVNVSATLQERAKQGLINEEMMSQRALSPVDLRRWVEETSELSGNDKNLILKNIFCCDCTVYLHTYTPPGIASVVGSVADRIKKIHQVFPNASVCSIDTKSEFFNGDEFDWPNKNSRRDAQYYPYQLGVYFDQVVHKEILRKHLKSDRFLRVKRTSLSVAVISAIGSSIGFASGWVGALFSELLNKQQYIVASVMGIGLTSIIILVGAACPFLFESWMSKLMEKE